MGAQCLLSFNLPVSGGGKPLSMEMTLDTGARMTNLKAGGAQNPAGPLVNPRAPSPLHPRLLKLLPGQSSTAGRSSTTSSNH